MLAARCSRRSVALRTNGAGRSSGSSSAGRGIRRSTMPPSTGRRATAVTGRCGRGSARVRREQLEGRDGAGAGHVERLHAAVHRDGQHAVAARRGPRRTARRSRCPAPARPARAARASSSDAPPASSPYTAKPAARSAAQPSAAVLARSTGARNATPAEALTTSGSMAGTPRRGSSTPSRPAAVALRSSMPTLAGLVTRSSTSTAAGPAPSSSRNSSTGAIRGATTSASTPWSCRPLPASTFTRCALARCTGTRRSRAAARMARTGSPRSPSARITLSTRSDASSSASSTGLRPYTVMKVSFGERGTRAA